MYLVNWKFKPFLYVIDSIGNLLFWWTKRAKFPQNPKRILVIRLDQIGDMIMTTPVFEVLKKYCPDAEVHVLCRHMSKDVLQNNPFVDKIITMSPPWHAKSDVESKWYSVIPELRGKYDVVFEMHGDPRNIVLSFLNGV